MDNSRRFIREEKEPLIALLEKENLKRDVLRKLVYSVGKDMEHAVLRDWNVALILAVRDRLIPRWMDTTQATYEQDRRRVYYLSMEFLIGRLLADTVSNLGLRETCEQVFDDLGVDLAAVYAAEPDAALGNGGLGRLAACFLDSMSSIGVPAYGYGIRYQHGLFRQGLKDGWQVEEAEDWLTQGGNPWEFHRSEASYEIGFGGVAGEQAGNRAWDPAERVYACANDMPIAGWRGEHINTLRLWSAKPAQGFDLTRFNQGEYLYAAQHEVLAETLTRILYPDDSTPQGRELRLKQEYFFTAASVQDVLHRFSLSHQNVDRLPEFAAIQLNDTHPAVAVAELVRILMGTHSRSFAQAFDITRKVISYTNHTLLPEALESWPLDLFRQLLPEHLEIIRRIDSQIATDLDTIPETDRRKAAQQSAKIVHGKDDKARVRMGQLAFVGSHKVNGVSALHTELMKKTVFADLHRAYPNRIVNMTNGITPRRWLYQCNPGLSTLITETIGDGWIGDLEQIEQLRPYANDSSFRERFANAKSNNKMRLAQFIRSKTDLVVDPSALFDVQIKRMHEYKRQLLNALEIVARYQAILDDPQGDWTPTVRIFSGKAAPSYLMAKLIIKLINDIAAKVNVDPIVGDRLKVVYLPNYNVSSAEVIIPAADISQQISTAGMEASGTGNMKLALNGALTIGTLDGANVEMKERVGDEHIHIFGLTAEEVLAKRNASYHPATYFEGDSPLARALKTLETGLFSGEDKNRYEPVLKHLRDSDYFMVLADYGAYADCLSALEAHSRDRQAWLKSAVINTSSMGYFSADRTIRGYASEIWST